MNNLTFVASTTASISLSLLLHDITDIASLSLRELDAVVLATNVKLFLGRDTRGFDLLQGLFNQGLIILFREIFFDQLGYLLFLLFV